MTFDRLNIKGLDDDESNILNHLLEVLHDKQSRNFLRASYYDGKRAIRQVGSIIPPQYYKLAIALGWTGKAVDGLGRRCNLDGLIWPDGDLDSLGFREVWDGNRLRTEFASARTSSLINGVAFLVNTRGGEAEDETAGLIHSKDASSATGVWNPRTRRLDNLLSITSRDADRKGKVNGFALYLYNHTITADKVDGKWEVERSDHTFGVPADPVVYKPRVGKPFGYSRISPVTMSMHDAGLRTLIRTEGHADVFSFPEMWMLGADESIFKNKDGSQKAAWQVMLGRIKGIPDDEEASQPRADVKQFPASSPQPHIELFSQQAKSFAGEHDIPVSSLGILAETNTTTEDGSNNAERNLIAEAEGATDDWSPAILMATMRAMAMQSGLAEIPREWLSIDAKWRPPAFLSRAALADAGMKQLAAIPWLADSDVGLELIGLDDQQIKRALADKKRSQATQRLTLLAQAAGQPPGDVGAP